MGSDGSLAEALAAWAVSVRVEDIPAPVMEAARIQLRAMLAAVYGGYQSPPVAAARRAALALGTGGHATIIPTGEKVHPYAAVLANAAASMAHDFDDYLFLGHTGHSSVLATLAAAEDVDATAEEMLVAQVVANEVAGRLGAFVAIGPQNGQMWSHIHLAAAALAAARLWKLSAAQATHALTNAFYQAPFTLFPGFFGAETKVMTAAGPAAAGLWSCMLAREGMSGAANILEHRQGFGHNFAFIPLPELVAGLGSSWVTESLSYKIYPGCAYIDGPVDAALQAVGDRGLVAPDIERIDIGATLLTTGMERLGETGAPTDSLDAIAINFSARRSVAIAVLARALTPRHLEGDWLAERGQDVLAIAARTRLRHSSDLTGQMLEGMALGVDLGALAKGVGVGRVFGARTAIRRSYGAVFSRGRKSAEQPLGQRLRTRFRRGREALGAVGELLRGLSGIDRPFRMDTADFSKLEFRFGAEVTIHLQGGEVLRGAQRIPFGAAGRPLSERSAHVDAKLSAEASAAMIGSDAIAALDQGIKQGCSARALAALACARS